jgi:hypothetical protein
VLYRNLAGDLGSAIKDLIVRIEAEEMAVSMEVWFDDYDFALESRDGSIEVIARNNDTSFLTWSIPFYGGTGKFDGRRVGRLLKNLEFSGMAFVTNPANVHSEILDSSFSDASSNTIPAAKTSFAGAKHNAGDTVSRQDKSMQTSANTQETRKMSEITVNQEKYATMLAQSERFAEMQQARDEAKASLKDAHAETKSVQEQLKAVSNDLATAKSAIEEGKKSYETLAAERQKLEAELALMTEAKKAADDEKTKCEKEKAALQTELDTQKKSVIVATRMAKLTSAGIKEDEAKAFVEKYGETADEVFNEMADLKITAFAKEQSLASIQDKLKKENLDPSIMNNLTTTEPPMTTTASTNDDDTEAFKALGSAILAGFEKNKKQ